MRSHEFTLDFTNMPPDAPGSFVFTTVLINSNAVDFTGCVGLAMLGLRTVLCTVSFRLIIVPTRLEGRASRFSGSADPHMKCLRRGDGPDESDHETSEIVENRPESHPPAMFSARLESLNRISGNAHTGFPILQDQIFHVVKSDFIHNH